MNVSDIKFCLPYPYSKVELQKMIDKLGKEETIKRFAWLLETKELIVSDLVEQILTDDYVDDKGVVGGNYFWE